jgi:thiamine-phosphate pyrophosphorylase
MSFVLPRLYAILDPSQTGGRPATEVCEALLEAGVRLIQYRDKQASSLATFRVCLDLAEKIKRQQGIFIVNDRADIALATGADGVHVGQEDLPGDLARRIVGSERWVGVSTHHLAQVTEADALPVDYVAFGPLYETRSKEKPDATVGLEGLRAARKATSKPLVAIGGITAENARAVIEAGADAVAVISGLVAASDPGARASEFLRVLGEAVPGA